MTSVPASIGIDTRLGHGRSGTIDRVDGGPGSRDRVEGVADRIGRNEDVCLESGTSGTCGDGPSSVTGGVLSDALDTEGERPRDHGDGTSIFEASRGIARLEFERGVERCLGDIGRPADTEVDAEIDGQVVVDGVHRWDGSIDRRNRGRPLNERERASTRTPVRFGRRRLDAPTAHTTLRRRLISSHRRRCPQNRRTRRSPPAGDDAFARRCHLARRRVAPSLDRRRR